MRRCRLTSQESFDIIRWYIKRNIDPKAAEMTSDYDFCLTVKKLIPLESPKEFKLVSMDGTGSESIVAVGKLGKAIEFDGDGWQVIADGAVCDEITDIALSSDGDLFAACLEGGVLRFDGTAWTDILGDSGEELKGVWCDAFNTVYAVGKDGAILRRDEGGWVSTDSGTDDNLADIWGRSADDIFAIVKFRDHVLNFDGVTWNADPIGLGNLSLYALHGDSDTIYAVGTGSTVIKTPCDEL